MPQFKPETISSKIRRKEEGIEKEIKMQSARGQVPSQNKLRRLHPNINKVQYIYIFLMNKVQ